MSGFYSQLHYLNMDITLTPHPPTTTAFHLDHKEYTAFGNSLKACDASHPAQKALA